MTEPQKMGIQEVMGLIEKFGEDCYYRVSLISNARDNVRSALTAFIEERDRALRERDELIALFNDVDRVVVGRLIADRDALRERVLALERAIKSGMEMAGDPSTCHFCGTLWSINDHAPDCIVRTLPKEPQ